MTVQSITTTVTATERRVRVALDDGTTREFTFGLVQDKDQKWVLPDPKKVAREVNALIESEAVAAQDTPDNAVAAELAAIAPETASITNVAQVGQPSDGRRPGAASTGNAGGHYCDAAGFGELT